MNKDYINFFLKKENIIGILFQAHKKNKNFNYKDIIQFKDNHQNPLSSSDLIQTFFEISNISAYQNPNPKQIISILNQVLEYLKSFQKKEDLPLKALLACKLDVSLSIITHFNFDQDQEDVENKIVQIFEFLGFCPSSFFSRFVKLGIVHFILDYLDNVPISDVNQFGFCFGFVVNFSQESESFVRLLLKRGFFDLVFENLFDFAEKTDLRKHLIQLFINICNIHFFLVYFDTCT